MATIANSPTPNPASFQPPARSPNTVNAAASDNSSDSRCATSVRTMPATRTERASTRKMPGNATARPSNASHGVCAAVRLAKDGLRMATANALAVA